MELPEGQVTHCLVSDHPGHSRGLGMERKRSQNEPIDALLLESMDEALTDLLGRRTREAVYDYLERNCLVAPNEIPGRLDDFFKLLNETFGKGGSTIGKVIAKRLYAKLGWEFVDIHSYELVDYVATARGRLEKEPENPTQPQIVFRISARS